MKLIINISETDYNTYKHFGDKGSYTERIIANGVPYKQDERPKGEWTMNNLIIDEWMCSVCREKFDDIPTCMGEPLYKFCPECGADLRGDV